METRVTPQVKYNERFSREENPFHVSYGALDDQQWLGVLLQSLGKREIDAIEFPAYPDEETQRRIHGHASESAMREAFAFYQFVRKTLPAEPFASSSTNFLDFAAGWGRISRPFLRDYPLRQMFAYEPNLAFASLARSLNPYLNVLTGTYLPNGVLAANSFGLVVGWSIFSHLSEMAIRLWFAEFARVLAPGGHLVMTTWGNRFLERLKREKAAMEAGEEIHWYSRVCLEAAGDLDRRMAEYAAGELVWFTNGGSKLYGEAFLPAAKINRVIREQELPLRLVEFDAASLSQDAFILRKI